MTEQHTILSMLEAVMSGVKNIADVNTIVGSEIHSLNNSIIIPISKVSIGLGVGGSDFGKAFTSKGEYLTGNSSSNGNFMFGGGTGVGITLSPVSFLVMSEDKVEVINVNNSVAKDLASGIGKFASGLMDIFKKKKKNDKNDLNSSLNEDLKDLKDRCDNLKSNKK